MRSPLDDYAAVLFDLDGVLTPTAEVHRTAWKRTFDAVLRHHLGDDAAPFTLEDYLAYVDGKPRFDGVHSFLASRGLDLAPGRPEEDPSFDTEAGVGNMKNDAFTRVLAEDGVDPYEGSVAVLDHLERVGVKVAVVSSSANAEAVLRAAGLRTRFEVIVDGVYARDHGLPGKPAPDTFVAAARLLGAAVGRSVVVEDAISGVEAGAAGGFGLVVGVDREGQRAALEEAGADLVVTDLAELLDPGNDEMAP